MGNFQISKEDINQLKRLVPGFESNILKREVGEQLVDEGRHGMTTRFENGYPLEDGWILRWLVQCHDKSVCRYSITKHYEGVTSVRVKEAVEKKYGRGRNIAKADRLIFNWYEDAFAFEIKEGKTLTRKVEFLFDENKDGAILTINADGFGLMQADSLSNQMRANEIVSQIIEKHKTKEASGLEL